MRLVVCKRIDFFAYSLKTIEKSIQMKPNNIFLIVLLLVGSVFLCCCTKKLKDLKSTRIVEFLTFNQHWR